MCVIYTCLLIAINLGDSYQTLAEASITDTYISVVEHVEAETMINAVITIYRTRLYTSP